MGSSGDRGVGDVLRFLDGWSEGASWGLVEGSEGGDPVLTRVDGREVVGIEVARLFDPRIAVATRRADLLVGLVEEILRRRGVDDVGVVMDVSTAWALAGGSARVAAELAALVFAGRATEIAFGRGGLLSAGIDCVRGLHAGPSPELFVRRAPWGIVTEGREALAEVERSRGSRIAACRAAATWRTRYLAAGARASAWLLVAIEEGAGISGIGLRSSGGFDRTFVLGVTGSVEEI